MRHPGVGVGEALIPMGGQACDERPRQGALAHISESLHIHDIVVMAGAQQLKKVEAALGAGRAEPGEMVVADLGADAIDALMTRAAASPVPGGPSTGIHATFSRPARSTSWAPGTKPCWLSISIRMTWRLETSRPIERNCASRRATV